MTTTKLPPEFKSKWIAALRSGEYKQATGELVDVENNAFCCLAIAGIVAGVSVEAMQPFGVLVKEIDGVERIPDLITESADYNTYVNCKNELAGNLTLMNDNGSSFDEIADYIEANL